MKKIIPFAALIAVVTIAIVTASNTAPPRASPATLAEVSTITPETTTAPPYEPTTHENGYCEGSCWEGSCPYFTGYPEPPFTYCDINLLAKMVWGEARGCAPEEQRLVVWTVLQRVDAGGEFRSYDTIEAVVTEAGQFVGYDESHPIDPDIYSLCLEVLMDWWRGEEPPTHEIYAPSAPYYFFDGDGTHNWFREVWK